MRHAPTSILSPYTTLFRSSDKPLETATITKGAKVRTSDGLEMMGTDRKSTRLNCSHSQISYAVCCLKKKSGGGGSCRTRACVGGAWEGTVCADDVEGGEGM